MRNAEFVALLIANTNKTNNLRTYGEKWYSGSRKISDTFLSKVGHIIGRYCRTHSIWGSHVDFGFQHSFRPKLMMGISILIKIQSA